MRLSIPGVRISKIWNLLPLSQFAREEIVPKAAEHDRTGEYPWEIIKKAHEIGIMNLHVPKVCFHYLLYEFFRMCIGIS